MTETLPTALPNPFVTSAPEKPLAGAEQATAPVGDAQDAVAVPSSRFEPDMNRLYLDIISMPEVIEQPLFLRQPPYREPTAAERKVSRRFIEALLKLGER